MRVLILTDSLGLPRNKPECVSYDETWPAIIKKTQFDILSLSVGGWTTADFKKCIKYYQAFNPDLLIIQIGIVDCAPRFVTKKEKFLLENFTFFGNRVLGWLNKRWIRNFRNITYVNKQEFKHNIQFIINTFPSLQKTVFIEIAGSAEFNNVLPGVDANIHKFNEILKAIPNSIFLSYNNSRIFMSDHHHLNVLGNKILSEKIYEVLVQEKDLFQTCLN